MEGASGSGKAGMLDNAAPQLRRRAELNRGEAAGGTGARAAGTAGREPIDALEVFEHIRDIVDPEHPHSLEELGVVSLEGVEVDDAGGVCRVRVVPTVAHCSMATLIGLSIKAKLDRALPTRFRTEVYIPDGAHSTPDQINKQLRDKERVCAALENPSILHMVDKALVPTET